MWGLNANAIHQYLNLAMGALSGLMIQSGCTQLANESLDCTGSYISPQVAAWLMLAVVVLKFVMNFGRDGLTGILKVQPPVADAVTTVVTPVNISKGATPQPTTTVEVVKNFNKKK